LSGGRWAYGLFNQNLFAHDTGIISQSMKWSLNPEYNLRNRQGLPEWSLRLGFSLLVPGA